MGRDEFHGLAATIRSATESETFDLGGLPSTTISQVIRDAFSREFELEVEEMIRITLVVGAGKGNRSKYDPSALKLVTTELSSAGYAEDRGASCVVESAGCYKFQHDTGKNLKTVVVFPKISNGKDEGDSGASRTTTTSSLIPPNSLEYKIAVSTVPLFRNMIKAKFPSWSQKRALLKLIDETLVEPLEQLDASLIKGELLSEDERIFYEQCVSVTEKKGLVKDAMSQQVQDEQLTASEVGYLLEQVANRLEEMQSKQQSIPPNLQERQVKLRSMNPIAPSPLKHHAALGKLWKQAAPLMYLNSSGAKLLSPAETKKKGQLEDILGEIAVLEESSRGLLEDDNSYEERIQSYRRDLQQRFGNLRSGNAGQKGSSRNVGGTGAVSSNRSKNAWSSTTKYQTPSVGGAKSRGWASSKDKKKKKGGLKNVDVFGAMMADSDSESDDDESQLNKSRNSDTNRNVNDAGRTPESMNETSRAPVASKKKNKKKKNKNKSNSGKANVSDDEILDAAVRAYARDGEESTEKVSTTAEASKQDAALSAASSILSLLLVGMTDYVIPFILAILTWTARSLFGKSQKKKSKKT